MLLETMNQELDSLETLDFKLEIFQSITRSRSNTWPLSRPEGFIETNPLIDIIATNIDKKSAQPRSHENNNSTECSSSNKKNQSTRNAHGSSSYAELITQAISSSKDQRLTLSEIYTWMIEHVPTIKDRKGTTGWKNSVRHNLSLHKRFVRVPNERAGKSSWWMINPNEIIGKSTRRRSATMEAKKYQTARSRAKKYEQRVNSEILKVEMTSDQCQLHPVLYPNNFNVEQPLPHYFNHCHIMQPIPNASTVNYTYSERLSPILAVSHNAEYYHPYEAVVEPDYSRFSTSRTNVEMTPLFISNITPDESYYNHSNEQTLTSFNSLLDDVTDIISKNIVL